MASKVSKKELSLYPSMLVWLKSYLSSKNQGARVEAYDVHSVDLSDFIQRQRFKKYFPEYSTYKIKVDLLGVIETPNSCELVFVEVKDGALSLINLSQLIGYCKIVQPKQAFLISPHGMGRPFHQLINHFKRYDILEYSATGSQRKVRIATWLEGRNDIDIGSVTPPFTS